uniref:Enoyl reductase (ER) domain-containing protein n=1 Tax=Anolis carolinensis TaxID=28377 RepID=A0A803TZY9_ANOCA
KLDEFLPVGREVAGVVVGILPVDSEECGLSAATLCDGVCVYTGLHYLSYVSTGKTLLVMHGESPFGTIAIQLAQHRGAKVIATVYSLEDKQYLQRLTPSVARIIDESNGKYDLTEICLEETGGLGVDLILDAGVKSHNKEDKVASQELLPHKHDIITLLSVGGHWVTMEENLHLDPPYPPDSLCLFLKVWNLSNMQQGKYLCTLEDIMEKLSSGIFRPLLDEPIPLYEANVSMEIVQKNQARKKTVVQLFLR